MSTISEKLKLKEGITALIINASDDFLKTFGRSNKLSKIVHIVEQNGKYDFILYFAFSSDDLKKDFPVFEPHWTGNGGLWLCYRKKNKNSLGDLTRDKGWDAVTFAGYRPVAMVAVDDQWAAIRWKKSGEVKGAKRNEYPEIDAVNRLVKLPDDFHKALEHACLLESFNKMSFTHKREYLEVVLEAKKTETRKRRIEKNIEMIRKFKKSQI